MIFIEIDKKKTKKNAHHLLNKYNMLVRIIGMMNAPKIDEEYFFELDTIIEKRKYSQDSFFDRKRAAKEELFKIISGMNQLEKVDRKFLYDKYMNKNYPTNIAIYMSYHMSESKFYRELDNVLLRFADAYDDGSLLVEQNR